MTNSRPVEERTFTTHDGVELFYRFWPTDEPRPKGAIVLFHRGHEHSGRMAHVVEECDLPGFAWFAWDARGQGRSPGPRGHSPSLGTSIRDVQTFIQHIVRAHSVPVEDIAVVAQSVGAVVVAAWMHDYAPKIRCAVLASPAFKVKLYVPFARTGLRFIRSFRGAFFVNSYVKAKFLTHDPDRIASYNSDPLIARPISVDILLALYDTAGRVVADAQAIHIPTQLLISGADWVVHEKPQHKFFDRLGSVTKEKHVFPGFYHDTFGEKERHLAIAKARDFIERQFAQPILPPNLLNEHLQGFTKNEADAIAAPLPWWSPRAWLWGLTRGSIRLGAHLSSGLRLGHETGFDSGSTLDCVYRNHPEGRTALGRYIDRSYLNSIGWRGIRQRKTHVEELLRTAMKSLAARGEPIHVLDIAAGHGRYVLDALTGGTIRPNSILLRDYSDINVREGDALIEQRGLGSVARFEKGDAFDRDAIANLNPRPTVAIVSGLYELFADNGMVGRSLAGIAAASPPGAYLIYTGQPWHPQLEFIGRALTSHRAGAAWVMRRRTQAELDQLVEVAGFRKIEQRIDEWGIFTVSLAERTGS